MELKIIKIDSHIDRVAPFTKTSDVIEVKGEDPATPGCLREVRVRWCVDDFHSWVHALLSRSLRNPGTFHLFPNTLGWADFEIIPTNNILPAHHL